MDKDCPEFGQIRRDVTPRLEMLIPDHRDPGAGIVGLMPQHAGLVGLVDRNHQRPDLAQSQPDQRVIDAARQHHQHPVALDHAGIEKTAPQRIGRAVGLRITHHPVAHQEQGLVRMLPGAILEQVMEDDAPALVVHVTPGRTA
jgi:hypothetical protein